MLNLALSGRDPKIRHVGRTTVRGIDVDHIRIKWDIQVGGLKRDGASVPPSRRAPKKTVTITRDVYVRHDNALPVRVVDRLGGFSTAENTTDVSEFTDVQKLPLDESTERALKLADHPGAKRRVLESFAVPVRERER